MTTTNRVPRHEGFPSPHVRRPLCEDLLCAACATRPGGGGKKEQDCPGSALTDCAGQQGELIFIMPRIILYTVDKFSVRLAT